MYKKIIYLSFLVCCLNPLFSDNKADSLYKLLRNSRLPDTTRINIYNELCWPVYSYSNIDSSIKYGTKAIQLSEKIQDTVKMVVAYRRLGIAYINSAKHKEALICEQKSYDLAKKIGLKKGMASALNNLSVIYLNISDFKTAIDFSIQSQKIQEELGDSTSLFNTYYNIALLFKNINELNSSRSYYSMALKIAERQHKNSEIAFAYSGIATILKRNNQFDSAYHYYDLALKSFTKENNLQGLIEVYINLGNINNDDKRVKDKSNFYKAISYYNTAYLLNKKYENQLTESNLYGNFATAYYNLKKYDSAIYFSLKAIELAKIADDKAEIVSSSKLLSELYSINGNFPLSLKYLNLHIQMKDSVYNYEKQKDIEQKQMRFEFERKVLSDSLKMVEEKRVSDAKIEKEKTIKYSLIFFVILLIVFSGFIFSRFKIIKSQKQIIEEQKSKVDEKQKEILDSINYAKRIQSTILNNQVVMKDAFSDYFILFKPKDIVSGDFYWAHRKANYFYLAVCDSTGHGVPGAFMSLLNIGFLNEAINDRGIEKPNEIFDFVRTKLIHSVSKEEQKDGFDGILICINVSTREITYSAANNKPIVISKNQIIEQQVDKMPVGKGERMQPFKLYQLNANSGDMLYLYTDGYADQFGGPKGKKFKYRPLNEMLLHNIHLSLSEQHTMLLNNFVEWRGDLEQVDDVCVMGIKL